MSLKHQQTVTSADAVVTKYVFRTFDELIIEFSYINKGDGKDIICLPCQTMCNLGCKFCHTTDYIGKIITRNLDQREMLEGIKYVVEAEKLGSQMLLMSFMGCGEPMCNYENVLGVMTGFPRWVPDVPHRFAVATCLPKQRVPQFFEFCREVQRLSLPVKLHHSLHYTDSIVRNEWMPSALDLESSLAALRFYAAYTQQPVEIHYALLEGLNDYDAAAHFLVQKLKDTNFNVKLLYYNAKDSLPNTPSSGRHRMCFEEILTHGGIKHEYYIPPGLDIGSSCGAFLMDTYEKFSTPLQIKNEELIKEWSVLLRGEIKKNK